MLWNTPDSDVKVYSAPLLVFQSYDIVEDPGEPLRVLLLQYSLHGVADDLVHVDSGEASHIVSTIGIVGLDTMGNQRFSSGSRCSCLVAYCG